MKSMVYPDAFQAKQVFVEKGKQTLRPIIVFNFHRFKTMLMGDLDNVSVDFENLRKDFKLATGTDLDKIELRISNTYGNEFKFVFKPVKFNNGISRYCLDVYGMGGLLLIYSEELPLFLETRGNVIDKLSVIMNKYHNGETNCWECGVGIEIEEAIKNNKFSKGFCDKCWEDGNNKDGKS
jgi:hypothetical protein